MEGQGRLEWSLEPACPMIACASGFGVQLWVSVVGRARRELGHVGATLARAKVKSVTTFRTKMGTIQEFSFFFECAYTHASILPPPPSGLGPSRAPSPRATRLGRGCSGTPPETHRRLLPQLAPRKV